MFMSGSKKAAVSCARGAFPLTIYIFAFSGLCQIRVVRSSTNMYEHAFACALLVVSSPFLSMPWSLCRKLHDPPIVHQSAARLWRILWLSPGQWQIRKWSFRSLLRLGFPQLHTMKKNWQLQPSLVIWIWRKKQGTPKSKGQSSLSLCTCHLGVYLIFSHTHLESL